MKWTAEQIRSLRQRLGWSRAELSRRVGIEVSVVVSWECGQITPGEEASNTLLSLDGYLRNYSQTISLDPQAETFLEKNKLNQILKSDLKNH